MPSSFISHKATPQSIHMRLVIIGPGLMPIPPKGWGAVESLIWDYAKFLERDHPDIEVSIVNEANNQTIIEKTNALNPDVVHIQYDDHVGLRRYIQCKHVLLTSHYGYLDQLPRRPHDGYIQNIFLPFLQSGCPILCLSPRIKEVYAAAGYPRKLLYCQPNGANEDLFRFTLIPTHYERSLYLAKIDGRKRQHVYQEIKSLYFAGNVADTRFNTRSMRYLGEWTKDYLYGNLTEYANLVLLSDGEAHPLVCCEALIAGLGLVISEYAAANLNVDLPFIDVIPNEKLDDIVYVTDVIEHNRVKSLQMRSHIRDYGLQNFSWKPVVDKYANYIRSLVDPISQFKKYLEPAIRYYHSDEEVKKYFGRVPKTRYDTFKYCVDAFNALPPTEPRVIVELGTSCSFVDGRFPGCNSDDVKYWQPEKPEIWDWSAGLFNRVFATCSKQPQFILHTVDLEPTHIQRCKVMTAAFADNIQYHVCPSEHFLSSIPPKSIDLLYLDTGDVMPVEPTAELHLREAQLIVKNNVMKDTGLILIDDVRNLAPKKEGGEISDFGKAKYSIPYLLQNGYEMVMDEYQVILKKGLNTYRADGIIETYRRHLLNCFDKTENFQSKLIPEIFAINGGMTGVYTKHFYNNLLEIEGARYLEIGCYTGSSTCSAMYGNHAQITCIDNWHDFILNELHNRVDKMGPIQEFTNNINKYKGDNTLKFYNEDCFALDTKKLGKFNIYLFDGEHSYEAQYKALTYYIDTMDDTFILLVDDWNWDDVRKGTFDAIRDLNLKIEWKKEIRLTEDNGHTPPELAHATWWNGIYVCILTKPTKTPASTPA